MPHVHARVHVIVYKITADLDPCDDHLEFDWLPNPDDVAVPYIHVLIGEQILMTSIHYLGNLLRGMMTWHLFQKLVFSPKTIITLPLMKIYPTIFKH